MDCLLHLFSSFFFSRFVESCKMCPVMASSCWRTHWSKEKQRENCEIWLWRRQRRLRPTCRRRDCRLSSGASSSWNGCSWPAARMAPSPQPSPPLHHRYPSASRRYSTLYSSFTTNVSIRRSAGKRPFRTFSIWVSAVCVWLTTFLLFDFSICCAGRDVSPFLIFTFRVTHLTSRASRVSESISINRLGWRNYIKRGGVRVILDGDELLDRDGGGVVVLCLHIVAERTFCTTIYRNKRRLSFYLIIFLSFSFSETEREPDQKPSVNTRRLWADQSDWTRRLWRSMRRQTSSHWTCLRHEDPQQVGNVETGRSGLFPRRARRPSPRRSTMDHRPPLRLPGREQFGTFLFISGFLPGIHYIKQKTSAPGLSRSFEILSFFFSLL